MAVIDTVRVDFDARWLGSAAIRQIEGDLTAISAAANRVEAAYRSVNPSSTDFFSFSTGDTLSKMNALNNEIVTIQSNMDKVRQLMSSGSLDANFGSALLGAGAERLDELNGALRGTQAVMGDTANVATRAGTSLGQFVSQYRAMIFSITAIGASVAGTIAAVRKVYEFAEAGAQVAQLTQSFDFFNESVSNTPNLLNEMRDASRGTISDLSLMSSFLTLVAGTSQELSKEFARTAPQLLEIAKAANVLNPALGDTQFFFESLARGIKRGEIRLLDNLGIIVKVGDANKKYAEQLGKTVDALSAEERQIALLNETLRVGANLIEQVGGSVDSLVDPYQRMSAAQENFTNSLKTLISLNFEPNPEPLIAMADALSRAAEAAVNFESVLDGVIAQYKALDDVPAGLDVLGKYLAQERGEGFFNGRGVNQAKTAIKELVLSTTSGAQSIDEALNIINSAYDGLSIEQGGFAGQFILSGDLDGEKINLVVTLDEIIAAIGDFSSNYEETWEGVRKSKSAPNAIRGQAQEIQSAAGELEDNLWRRAWRGVANDYVSGLEEAGKAIDAAEAEAERIAAAIERQNALAVEAIAGIQEARAAWYGQLNELRVGPIVEFATGDGESDLIVGNINDVGEAWVTTTNATEAQNEALERYREELDKASKKLDELNLGIGTFGDEQDDVSKAIEKASGEVDYYANKIAALEGQLTSSTNLVNRRVNVNDANVYKGIIEAMEGAGAASGLVARAAQEFGLLSPAAAEAAASIGLVTAAYTILGEAIANGEITPTQAKTAIDNLIKQIEDGLSVEEIIAEVRVDFRIQDAKIARNAMLPDEDQQQTVDLAANIDPATRKIYELLGIIPKSNDTEATKLNVSANTDPAVEAVDALVEDINKREAQIRVQINYDDPGNPNVNGTSSSTNTSSNTGTYTPDNYTPSPSPTEIIPPPSQLDLGGGPTSTSTYRSINITVNQYGNGNERQSSTSARIPGGGDTLGTIIAELARVGVTL